MPPFFSYNTFTRLSVAALGFWTKAISGEAIAMSPEPFAGFGRTPPGGLRDANGVRPEAFASYEGAQASDGFADDQILHLIRAFVGVERLAIGKEPRGLIVGDDAVAA